MTAPDAGAPACPAGMILVEGEYCPFVEQRCLEWLDPPTDPYAHFRCAKYARPAVCHSKRVHERFCIDATERVEPGSDLRGTTCRGPSRSACASRRGRASA